MNLYLHTSGYMHGKALDVDRPWRDRIRSQIFCQNQEEKDYLSSLNLMHGREIMISIWDEWKDSVREYLTMTDAGVKITVQKPRVLPVTYTTWPTDLTDYWR